MLTQDRTTDPLGGVVSIIQCKIKSQSFACNAC